MVELRRFADVEAFLAAAGPFLETREAEHNLLFGICAHLRRDPGEYGAPPYLSVASRGGEVVGVALRTPPFDLVLSEMGTAEAIERFALDAAEAFPDLDGFMGPRDVARSFADVWERNVGRPGRLGMRQRIYRAMEATPPTTVPGRRRAYRVDDRETVVDWLEAFVAEVFRDQTVREDPARVLERRLADPDGGFVLWEDDGRAVSLAGFGTPTPNGTRVGPVYTPPEFRGNGYASALVGEMTATLLERRPFCFLFTDLGNPTSNAIYQRIGYEPVSDVDRYRFDPPPGGQRAASTTSRTAE